MNKSNYLNLLLSAALVIVSAKAVSSASKEKDEEISNDSIASVVLDNIGSRTSIRSYKDKSIEESKVEKILKAAMSAPSAGNKQPWRFIVVTDRKILEAISENMHTVEMAKKAPLAIIVCGDMTQTFPSDGKDYWIEDASAATENLLLAAHSLGLGAVWCGVYPMTERVSFIKKLLGLPTEIVPLNVIPIGYPDESPKPKDKWKPENIHYNTWHVSTQ